MFFGEGTGGSRSATMSGSAFHNAAEKIITKAKAIAAHNLKVDVADVNFAEGIFSSAKTNQTMTIKEVAETAVESGEAAEEHGGRAQRQRGLHRRRREFSRTAATSARSRSTRTPAQVEIVRYSVVDDVGTVINPLLLKGQIVGGVAQGVGQILMEDIRFDARGPARSPARSWTTPCRARATSRRSR